MTGEELLRIMDVIDPKLVESAGSYPTQKRRGWAAWCAIAAAAVAIAVLIIGKAEKGTVITVGGIERNYKTTPVVQVETAPYYPWEYLTEMERYTCMVLDGNEYRTRARTVDPAHLDERIGEGFFTAPDVYTGLDHSLKKEVFSIQGVSASKVVAVELGDVYCVFYHGSYSPPLDFGTFWEEINLSNTVELNRFSYSSGSRKEIEQTSFLLENDTILWELLASCRTALHVEQDPLYDVTAESVSFSVTSDKLGVYKHSFRISADGYISTNLMEWGYAFHIGEEAARKIIDYAMKNSKSVPFEPYYQFLYGTFVGMEEGFLLVDDTSLCVNPAEGMVFRIPTADIRISRSVELGHIGVGDIVLVNFTGTVDTASGNKVLEPVSIQRGILLEGNVLIEE